MVSRARMSLAAKFLVCASVVLVDCALQKGFAQANAIDRLNKVANATMDIRNSIRAVAETVGEQPEKNIELKGETETVSSHNLRNNYTAGNALGSIFNMVQSAS